MKALIKALNILKEPFIHLVIGEGEKLEKIIDELAESNNKKEAIFYSMIEGRNCQRTEDLFQEFASKLKFPSYFGKNWAAFDECLNDLEWLNSEKFILFIRDSNSVLVENNNDFQVFVNILTSAINEWTSGRDYDSFPTPPASFHLALHCSKENADLLEARFNDIKFNRVIL